MKLILRRNFTTPQSEADITTFSKEEKFRIASNSSFQCEVGHGSSPGHALHPFLLALHTNLAADVAKLGASRAHLGGEGVDTGGRIPCIIGAVITEKVKPTAV